LTVVCPDPAQIETAKRWIKDRVRLISTPGHGGTGGAGAYRGADGPNGDSAKPSTIVYSLSEYLNKEIFLK
jgi:hypothetical protein